jgi:hypothetical protein
MTEKLPSGNTLITDKDKGTYLLLITNGPGIGVEILGPNEHEPGTPEWFEKENEIAEVIKKFS